MVTDARKLLEKHRGNRAVANAQALNKPDQPPRYFYEGYDLQRGMHIARASNGDRIYAKIQTGKAISKGQEVFASRGRGSQVGFLDAMA